MEAHQALPRTVTVPAVPSTSSMVPSTILSVALATATTQSIPNSRDTMPAWLISAPTLTTTALGWQEQRRPGWVGQRRHQDIAGRKPARIRWIENDPRTAAGDAGRAAVAP